MLTKDPKDTGGNLSATVSIQRPPASSHPRSDCCSVVFTPVSALGHDLRLTFHLQTNRPLSIKARREKFRSGGHAPSQGLAALCRRPQEGQMLLLRFSEQAGERSRYAHAPKYGSNPCYWKNPGVEIRTLRLVKCTNEAPS